MGLFDSITKIALIGFNILFLLCGIAIMVLGVLSYTDGKLTTHITNNTITGSSIALIVIGVVVFLIAFLGCCGAVRDSTCMLYMYAAFILVILVLEIGIGVYAFVNKDGFKNDLQKNIERIFNDYKNNRAAIDPIQSELKCCGIDGPWNYSSVPQSCCENKKSTCNANTAYQAGCEDKLIDLISSMFQKVSIGAIVVGGIEFLGVLFSCFLVSSIKRNANRGHV